VASDSRRFVQVLTLLAGSRLESLAISAAPFLQRRSGMAPASLDGSPSAALLGQCRFADGLARTSSAEGREALVATIAAAHLGEFGEAREHSLCLGEAVELAAAGGPLVSVIIPTHDRRELFRRAVASVEAQTYRPLELVVVNDAGPDVVDLLPRPSADLSWRVHHNSQNLFHSRSRNAGLGLARGEWLLFLDDDDLLYPHHVGHLLATALSARAELVTGVSLLHRREGQHEQLSAWPAHRFSVETLARQNVVPIQAVLLRRELQQRVGEFAAELTAFEDWDFWLRAAKQARGVAQTGTPTSCVDQRPGRPRVSCARAGALQAYENLVARHQGVMRALRAHHEDALATLRRSALGDLARERKLALVVFEHRPPTRGWAAAVARAMAPLPFAEDWAVPVDSPWSHALALERLLGQSRADLLVVIDPALATALPASVVSELALKLEAAPRLAAVVVGLGDGSLPACLVVDRRAARRVYSPSWVSGLAPGKQWLRLLEELRTDGWAVREVRSPLGDGGRAAQRGSTGIASRSRSC
jgi:hypothetical protein